MLARVSGRVLRLNMAGSDYLFVGFSRGRAYVHQLVLEAFVGPRPARHQAAHGDGNPLNNTLANLRWATPKENEADKRLHGTLPVGTKSAQGRKTQCPRGHPYNEQNTHRANGRRFCRSCRRDQTRRYRGTPPSRYRTPIEPRLRKALRLVAEGMSATRAAQIAKVGLNTIARARRSGAYL